MTTASRTKVFLATLIATAIVCIIIAIVLFHYYQIDVAYGFLQGYWSIGNNMFMIIDDHTMRFIEITGENTFNTLYTDDNIRILSKSYLPKHRHYYELVRSKSDTITLGPLKHPFNHNRLAIEVCPIVGVISIEMRDRKTFTLFKDSEMSLAFLSA